MSTTFLPKGMEKCLPLEAKQTKEAMNTTFCCFLVVQVVFVGIKCMEVTDP